jgi:predicted nucleotidyltransferase
MHETQAVRAVAQQAEMQRAPEPRRLERPEEVPKQIAHGVNGDRRFAEVLGESTRLLENAGISYALIGGVASCGFGRPRTTRDIDVFLHPVDAERALQVLESAGYQTERTDPKWIFKGFKHGVQVDVIFLTVGGVYFDDEMRDRAIVVEFAGQRVRIVAPEDLLVIKAAVHDEPTPRHWHDALGLVAARELDWEYLLRRARRAQRRVLSLLIYAQSNDLAVPNRVVRSLFEQIYD